MKAISLWQPWASAVAYGSKRIETRSWYTSYRGPLAIHAAKRRVKRELRELARDPAWRGALYMDAAEPAEWLETSLPFGAIVATCRLVDCRRTELFSPGRLCELRGEDPFRWTEEDLGDFSPFRYGWVLADVRMLHLPVYCRGARGLFEVDEAEIERSQS